MVSSSPDPCTELKKVERRRDWPWGGLKITLASSSWLMPRSEAAFWAAPGLRNLSLVPV